MAITTLAGVKAALQPPSRFALNSNSPSLVAFAMGPFWASPINGYPKVGAYDTTAAGVTLTSPVAGGLNWRDPPSGNAYLARMQGAGCTAGSYLSGALVLYDRLWHSGGYSPTTTTAQTVGSPTWPARDENGSTDGRGVIVALEIQATVGAGTPTPSIEYTSSDGATVRTGNMIPTWQATSPRNSMYPFGWASGDRGVKSVQSLTLGVSITSGSIGLVAYRPIAILPLPGNMTQGLDVLGLCMPRLYNGSVLSLYIQAASNKYAIGELQFAFG